MSVDMELKEFIEKLDPASLNHGELAVMYMNLGDAEKARQEFKESASEGTKLEARLPDTINQITAQGIVPRALTDEEKGTPACW
jgi:hypothetical protein